MSEPREKSKLNEDVIKSLTAPEAGNRIHYFPDATLQGKTAPRGFGVRVTAAGVKSFVLNYRVRGIERRFTIGRYPDWTVLDAVQEARKLRQRIDRGEDPMAGRVIAPTVEIKTVETIVSSYLAGLTLRSRGTIASVFRRQIIPAIGERDIYGLRKLHVAEMVDKIAAEAGPVAADRARSYLRAGLAWFAERDDQFNLTAVMPSVTPRAGSAQRARSRVLTDDEVRTLWPLFGEAGKFGAIARVLLLTGQRRNEIAGMARREIDADGVWTLPRERDKVSNRKVPHSLLLSPAVLSIISEQPRVDGCDLVFPASTGRAFADFAGGKKKLDKLAPLPQWGLHDLRRTAKTLMQRAGVAPHVSERILGHVTPHIEAVYDHHRYLDEKRAGLEALGALIERILNPPAANVTSLRA